MDLRSFRLFCLGLLGICVLTQLPCTCSFDFYPKTFEKSVLMWQNKSCLYPEVSTYTSKENTFKKDMILLPCKEIDLIPEGERDNDKETFAYLACQLLYRFSFSACNLMERDTYVALFNKTAIHDAVSYDLQSVCTYASRIELEQSWNDMVSILKDESCKRFCDGSLELNNLCKLLVSGLCQASDSCNKEPETGERNSNPETNQAKSEADHVNTSVNVNASSDEPQRDLTSASLSGQDTHEGNDLIPPSSVRTSQAPPKAPNPAITVDRNYGKTLTSNKVETGEELTSGKIVASKPPTSATYESGKEPTASDKDENGKTPTSEKNEPGQQLTSEKDETDKPQTSDKGGIGKPPTTATGETGKEPTSDINETGKPPPSDKDEPAETSASDKDEHAKTSASDKDETGKVLTSNIDETGKVLTSNKDETGKPPTSATGETGKSLTSDKDETGETPTVNKDVTGTKLTSDTHDEGLRTQTELTNGKTKAMDQHPTNMNDNNNMYGDSHKPPLTFEDETPGSGHFFAYFLTAVVICISGYVVFHNKQKILAFIVEGRNGREGSSRRRTNSGVEYTQLKSNVEEVMPSLEKSTTSKNFVY